MQVSSQTNNYQTLNSYQRPVQPIEQPNIPKPEYDAKDLYKATNGNAIIAKDDNVENAKAQAEIYLSVATGSQVDLDDGTATVVESLRKTQKENNIVQAYAQYQENQKNTNPIFF